MKIDMELENFTQASSVALSKNSQRNLDFRSDMISPTTSDILIASSPQENNTSVIFTIEEDEISNIEKNPDRKIRQFQRSHSFPRRKLSQRDGRNKIRFNSFDAVPSTTSNNTTNPNNINDLQTF